MVLYVGKYDPPEEPSSAQAVKGMGVESFALYPQGFQNGVICPDSTFPMLDHADRLAVLHTRLYWAVRNDQEAAMNAPFVDIAKAKFHG